MELQPAKSMQLTNALLTRQAEIIPIEKNIIERPSNIIKNSEAVDLLTTAPVVSQQIVLPPATLPEVVRNDAGETAIPIPDPGPPVAPGMGSQLVTWIKNNPLPAVAIGIGALWLIHEMTSKKK